MTTLEDGEVYYDTGTGRKTNNVQQQHPYSAAYGHDPQYGSSGLGSSSAGPGYMSQYDGASAAAYSTDNLLSHSLRDPPPSRAFEANTRRERGEMQPNRSGLVAMMSWHLRGGKTRFILLLAGVSMVIFL